MKRDQRAHCQHGEEEPAERQFLPLDAKSPAFPRAHACQRAHEPWPSLFARYDIRICPKCLPGRRFEKAESLAHRPQERKKGTSTDVRKRVPVPARKVWLRSWFPTRTGLSPPPTETPHLSPHTLYKK